MIRSCACQLFRTAAQCASLGRIIVVGYSAPHADIQANAGIQLLHVLPGLRLGRPDNDTWHPILFASFIAPCLAGPQRKRVGWMMGQARGDLNTKCRTTVAASIERMKVTAPKKAAATSHQLWSTGRMDPCQTSNTAPTTASNVPSQAQALKVRSLSDGAARGWNPLKIKKAPSINGKRSADTTIIGGAW